MGNSAISRNENSQKNNAVGMILLYTEQMSKFELTPTELQKLRVEHPRMKRLNDSKKADRLKSVFLLGSGWSAMMFVKDGCLMRIQSNATLPTMKLRA